MTLFSRYLIRYLFTGFAAAAGLLLPLFSTFNLINELDDVSPAVITGRRRCWWC